MTTITDRRDAPRTLNPTLPPAVAGLLPPGHPITEAVALCAQRRTELHAANTELDRTEALLRDAPAKDTAALADALAAGKPDPGQPHRTEAEQMVAEARRLKAARVALQEQALTAFRAAWREHGLALASVAEQGRERTADRVRELLTELGRELDRHAAHRALGIWADTGKHAALPSSPPAWTEGVRSLMGWLA